MGVGILEVHLVDAKGLKDTEFFGMSNYFISQMCIVE